MSEQGLSWRDARLAIPPTRAQALASDGAIMTPLEWLLVALIDAAIFRRFEAEYIERGFWAHWTSTEAGGGGSSQPDSSVTYAYATCVVSRLD